MKHRHAVGLALIGWYLMMPPPSFDFETKMPTGDVNTEAPYAYWGTEGSFDTAAQCSAAKDQLIREAWQTEARVRATVPKIQQERDESEMDAKSHAPKGYSHALRHRNLEASIKARCVATGDPRLNEK